MQLLRTGIPAFDRLFGGGGIRVSPTEGTSMLIEGDAGMGKTTLALQLATAAVQNEGATCLFYSFDETASELKAKINSFGWTVTATATAMP